MGTKEDSVYADLAPTFKKTQRLFSIDPRLRKDKRKGMTCKLIRKPSKNTKLTLGSVEKRSNNNNNE